MNHCQSPSKITAHADRIICKYVLIKLDKIMAAGEDLSVKANRVESTSLGFPYCLQN